MTLRYLNPRNILRFFSSHRSLSFFVLMIFCSSIVLLVVPNFKGKARAANVIYPTGSSWTVPSDWNNNNNTIEVIGGGGGGAGGNSNQGTIGSGGGGGGYAKITNVTLTAGQPVTIAIGSGGSGGNSGLSGTPGGNTYVCNTNSGCTSITSSSVIVGATGGTNGNDVSGSGGPGGSASVGTGFSGGSGGGGGTNSGSSGGGGGGGGGAAGMNGPGTAAKLNVGSTLGVGGQGDSIYGGAGGSTSGASGSNGSEWDSIHGSGGGGAGGSGGGSHTVGSNAGGGGSYGAGGGGGGSGGKNSAAGGTGGSGSTGLIVITYTPPSATYTQSSYRWFANADSTTPGSPLASQNTAAQLTTTGQSFRLRQLIKPSLTIGSGAQSLNEQYAALSTYGTCSAVPTDSWYALSGSQSATLMAGAGADDSSNGGAVVWSSPGSITVQDGTPATAVLTGNVSQYLKATNFGFNIPANATITGISANVYEENNGFNALADSAIRLVKNGVIGSTDKSSAAAWSQYSYSTASYGGSADLWGDTWAPSDVNSSNFGFAMAATSGGGNATANVDSISITVYYTFSPLITYYNNPTPASGAAISATANDPTDSGQTVSPQTYQEADGWTTTSTIGGTVDGEWDLSLYDNGAPENTTYCFRTVKADGTPLDTYSYYPMITTAPGTDQFMRGGEYFSGGSKQGYFWAK